MISKFCEYCNKEFKFYPSEKKRKFCSQKCYWDSMKGVTKINEGGLKKGHIPWNKGLTKETDKRVKKYAKRMIGKKRISNCRINCIKCNKEVLSKLRSRKYCENCRKEALRENWRRKYYKNKDKILLKQKEYKKEYNKKYRQNNKEELKKYKNEYTKNRRKKDKRYNIRLRLRSLLYMVLKIYTKTGKIMSSRKYGVSYEAIIKKYEKDGLPEDLSNYENHHIKQLFTFNLMNKDGSINIEEVKKAFAPENLILITKEEHKEIHRELNHNLLK